MDALILTPADCEVWSMIKFLNAQSTASIEIHRQLCQIYGPNVMSKQMELVQTIYEQVSQFVLIRFGVLIQHICSRIAIRGL